MGVFSHMFRNFRFKFEMGDQEYLEEKTFGGTSRQDGGLGTSLMTEGLFVYVPWYFLQVTPDFNSRSRGMTLLGYR